GARVVTAASSPEALEILEPLRPHLLIADIELPGANGYELLCEVRQRPPEQGGRVPAMALTAHAYPKDRQRGLLSGFQAYMTKPFDSEELVKAVAQLARLTGKVAYTAPA